MDPYMWLIGFDKFIRVYLGIMEKRMEVTMMGYTGYRV